MSDQHLDLEVDADLVQVIPAAPAEVEAEDPEITELARKIRRAIRAAQQREGVPLHDQLR